MTDTAPKTNLVTVTVDGTELQVPKGTLVIRAAEQLGITIPRFCDHPLLDPLGACRQCIVEVEGQRKPMTSCTTTCTDGMIVKTHLTSEVAREAQEGILEFLLINHPLDCPQCDKGGECPLQDQTLGHGPEDSRFIDDKRRFIKPLPISAQVALDRERCVLCARCTRFSSEISGDPFIELFERGALEQVAIYEDEPYESYFSGNVVQICPVGALTAASYRFKARPFDLGSYPGVCNQCSAGCNLRIDARRGEIQRQLARENMAVNEMWNCDRGRFGYEYVASAERLREPIARNELGSPVATGWLDALRAAARGFKAALDTGPSAAGVITGGRLTDEDAYAVSRFARDVLGTNNVDFRLKPRTDEEHEVLAAVAGTMSLTYDELEHTPTVVIAGLDPTEEVPILFLRLRKGWRRHRQKIIVVGPTLGHLDEIAWTWLQTPAGGEAAVLDALRTGEGVDEDVIDALGGGLAVLAGERLAQSPGALRAAAALATQRDADFAWVPRKTNARGAVDAGLLPTMLPGGRSLDQPGLVDEAWSGVPAEPGLDTRQMLEAAAAGELKALYLVGVDIARDFEDPRLARAALDAADHVVVQDLLYTETARYADVILPAMSAQERVGSFTSWEGRRQPFSAAVPTQGLAQHDWDITRQLAAVMGFDFGWESADDVRREAAPLFEAAHGLRDKLSKVQATSAPAPAAGPGDDLFGVVVVDQLLAPGGSMLGDAKALIDTARPVAVWVNPADAERLGIADGAHVALVGSANRLELPALVTDRVVAGCVVVPGNSSFVASGAGQAGFVASGASQAGFVASGAGQAGAGVAPGSLVEAGEPLRVRLEKAEGFSDVRYPSQLRAPVPQSDAHPVSAGGH